MRRILLAAVSALGLAAIAAPASASTLSAGACVPASFAATCAPTTLATGPSPLLSLPASAVGNFEISGSATAGSSGTSATFNSQTLQVSTTGAGGLLDIFFTVTGVPSMVLPLAFVSTFTSNQQNATTHQVRESSWTSDANVAYSLATNLATVLLTSPIAETAGPIDTTHTPAALQSFTELYQIELEGCGTQPSGICTGNLTIDLSASAIPEPASIALFGVGLLGLGVVVRRRRNGRANAVLQ